MHHPTDRITHTTAFVTPVVEHWLEREIGSSTCVCVCFIIIIIIIIIIVVVVVVKTVVPAAAAMIIVILHDAFSNCNQRVNSMY